jgi:chorismate mutase
MGMTDLQERLARERAEIAARVASFRATQEKFQREREEFVSNTWQNIRKGEPVPRWS